MTVMTAQGPSPSLEAAGNSAAVLPRLRSLLVSHRGQLVLERYYGGVRPTQAANIKSASKSVISALVGIAVSRGLIKSLDQRLQLVVVTTSRSDVSQERRDHLGAIYDLIEQQVIPAVIP